MSKLFKIAAFLLAFSGGTCLAQKSNSSVSSDIYNTWYEWPHENANQNTVYKTVKYEPIPGIDKQDEPFSKLIIKNDGSFIKTQYCGYCPAVKLEETTGKFVINNSTLDVTFKGAKSVAPLTVVAVTKDKLTINFQHTINTK